MSRYKDCKNFDECGEEVKLFWDENEDDEFTCYECECKEYENKLILVK